MLTLAARMGITADREVAASRDEGCKHALCAYPELNEQTTASILAVKRAERPDELGRDLEEKSERVRFADTSTEREQGARHTQ
jgi:hypothetical protein